MRRAALAMLMVSLLVATSLAGCIAYDDFQKFVNRVQGKKEFATVERFNEDVEFALTDAPPSGLPPGIPNTTLPPSTGKSAAFNFTIPSSATELHIEITASFTTSLPQQPPQGTPRGNVTVTLAQPSGGALTYTFAESGVKVLDQIPPQRGAWGVRVQAIGDGDVHVLALTREPAA